MPDHRVDRRPPPVERKLSSSGAYGNSLCTGSSGATPTVAAKHQSELAIGGTGYSAVTDHSKDLGTLIPPIGGISTSNWDSPEVGDPAAQAVEETTAKCNGKVWQGGGASATPSNERGPLTVSRGVDQAGYLVTGELFRLTCARTAR
jgi:hypothetical protein